MAERMQHHRSLALYNNMSDDAGAAAIAGLLGRAPRMESFRMASSRVGAAGGIALAEGLSAGDGQLRGLMLFTSVLLSAVGRMSPSAEPVVMACVLTEGLVYFLQGRR